MGFLKKLFGGGNKPYVDKHGIYFYAQCDNCSMVVKVRADKQHDFNRTDKGFVWHKTIVDSKCFRRMQAVVHMDEQYQMQAAELSNGRLVTEADYEAWLASVNQPTEEDEETT